MNLPYQQQRGTDPAWVPNLEAFDQRSVSHSAPLHIVFDHTGSHHLLLRSFHL